MPATATSVGAAQTSARYLPGPGAVAGLPDWVSQLPCARTLPVLLVAIVAAYVLAALDWLAGSEVGAVPAVACVSTLANGTAPAGTVTVTGLIRTKPNLAQIFIGVTLS